MKVFLLIVPLLIKNLHAQDEGILCSARTCADYISANPCPALPDDCKLPDSTHSGLFLPSPDPCNCCQYCLVNLKEGAYCSVGEVGGLIPNSICGPGLYCSPDTGTCVKMSTIASPPPCSKSQANYDLRRDQGILGFMELRPECDDDGYFAPYRCVPGQTCFCVDQTGERIFGEIPYSSTAHLTMKCQCSRKYKEILKFFDLESLRPDQHFRCAENGDYDTIQCIGEQCMCTDASDGAPTYPTEATVNITAISNTILPDCFKEEFHETEKYYHACAESYLKVEEEFQNYLAEGYDTVFGMEYPSCDLDGKYAPVQKGIDTEGAEYLYCANPDGTPIKSPSGLVYHGTTDATTVMNCLCARSSLLISEGAFDTPQCCVNGNFNKVQCRRGKCYCVDADGYQDASKQIEVDIDSIEQLTCYNPNDECLGPPTP